MKVKILQNVVVGAKVAKKDQVIDVPPEIARRLIDKEHAERATDTPKQQEQQKPPTDPGQ